VFISAPQRAVIYNVIEKAMLLKTTLLVHGRVFDAYVEIKHVVFMGAVDNLSTKIRKEASRSSSLVPRTSLSI
jgi:hypothetical protein